MPLVAFFLQLTSTNFSASRASSQRVMSLEYGWHNIRENNIILGRITKTAKADN
jgi:hypothetical protein